MNLVSSDSSIPDPGTSKKLSMNMTVLVSRSKSSARPFTESCERYNPMMSWSGKIDLSVIPHIARLADLFHLGRLRDLSIGDDADAAEERENWLGEVRADVAAVDVAALVAPVIEVPAYDGDFWMDLMRCMDSLVVQRDTPFHVELLGFDKTCSTHSCSGSHIGGPHDNCILYVIHDNGERIEFSL